MKSKINHRMSTQFFSRWKMEKNSLISQDISTVSLLRKNLELVPKDRCKEMNSSFFFALQYVKAYYLN